MTRHRKPAGGQGLTGGLKRTSTAIGTTISDLVMRGPLTSERIEEIEETLIRADLGVDVAARIATIMGEGRYHILKEVKQVPPPRSSRSWPRWRSRSRSAPARPFVILVVGVNGSGKTTTSASRRQIHRRRQERDARRRRHLPRRRNRPVEIWAGRSGATRAGAEHGADAAGLATTRSWRRAARRSTC